MSLCQFVYEEVEGGYAATCVQCERSLRSKSREVYAACKASPDYDQTHSRIAGLVPGPGAHLKSLIRRWMKIEPTGNCPCDKHAKVMDMWGPDECERRLDEIVGWLREEHAARRGNGETSLPWSDFGARQLVKLACRRARAKAST